MKNWPLKLIFIAAMLGLGASIAFAKRNNVVTMAYQSAPALLKRASLISRRSPHSIITLTISLKLRNVEKLQNFLDNVQNPASSVYHQFLTPMEFTSQYGPSQAQVDTVVQFLKRHGIGVKNVSSNHLLIHTEAETTFYEHALGIRLNDYSLNGRSFYSTPDQPQLPANIASNVANIIGLNNAVQMRPLHHIKPLEAGSRSSENQQVVANSPTPPPPTTLAYNPMQIATAYDWPPITDNSNGEGVTTAILTADSYGLSSNTDYTNFWSAYGLPDHTVNIIHVDGEGSTTDGMVETLLDIEWSGAMGPGEGLSVYVATNSLLSTFIDMYNQFVTDNTSQVMTTSWGAPESTWGSLAGTSDEIFMQAAAQGISMFAAAGDHDSSDGGPIGSNMADYPSSDPYITASNGTELYVADVSGAYSSETAWSETGGAISGVFVEPTWQSGPGVPANGWRNNSDMAMNAGPDRPYLLLYQGAWYDVRGTSAVAPQLASLYAIGISDGGGNSLGQSNELIYSDVAAGNYASDFHDVTTGGNGAYQAGPDWDHPTGWGSPRAISFLSHLGVQGPAGTLAGTVTDAISGNPVTGAEITIAPGNYQRPVESDGSYSMRLPVGTYTATVSAFGYGSDSASVTITDGNTTTQNYALSAAHLATVSGRVTDGSGHGYGLYAEVKVTTPAFGIVKDLWTNPKTGGYSVNLPEGYEYTLAVAAFLDGYDPGNVTITNLSAATTQNFVLMVGESCSAPGYAFESGFGEDFNEASFPPDGWTVTNEVAGSPVVWNTNTFWGDDNWTSGTGTAADVNSGNAYPYTGTYDTSLVTPLIPAANLGDSPTLSFKVNFIPYSGNEALDVDMSSDGGDTWMNLAHITTVQGLEKRSGITYKIPLSIPDGVTNVQFRWRYYNLISGWDLYAQIDDVSIGPCAPIPGGLVDGQVYDANTKQAVDGATVTDENGNNTQTFTSNGESGFMMFEPTGPHTLTATKSNYQDGVKNINMGDSSVLTPLIPLNAGQLVTRPAKVTVNVPVGTTQTYVLHIGNAGHVSADWQLQSLNGPPDAPNGHYTGLTGNGAPLQNIHGHFTPLSLHTHNNQGNNAAGRQLGPQPHDPPWTDIADYPTAIMDNCAAADEAGRVYSFDGYDGDENTSSVYMYDPTSGSWSSVSSNPTAVEAPACAYINGKFYLADGWDATTGAVTPALQIYDPSSDSWSTGADNPNPLGGGVTAAALNGKLYLIGGCDAAGCGYSTVEVYDPATNSWSTATSYPHAVSWEGCGAINGKIYCAGGTSGTSTEYSDGYQYDPGTNAWSPIADLPISLWGMAWTTAGGQLLISGGVTNNFTTITNQGFAYDPGSNAWNPLPNSNNSLYRGGSAIGFYKIGGSSGGLSPVPDSELLPGYEPVPWLSFDPASGTLAGRHLTVSQVTVDGTGQTAGTTSVVQIRLSGNTPYAAWIIPFTVHWIGGEAPAQKTHKH